jgi:serine/threonine protein kinase
MSILPRELASRFAVLEKMGEGGMGAVYKVRHNELDRICVIKVMQARLQNNAALRQRFLGEAKKGAQVSHPNIAAVLDFFVGSNGTACLVMEYIDGRNLLDVLEANDGPLDYKMAVEITLQALDALACLHSRKLVHRDISPDNLMLTHDSAGRLVVKLIDLGIAKSLEPAADPGSTNFFIGKYSYAPPEQFGNQVDTRSDIYAMGAVLYQLLTKKLPIVASDFASYYAAHLRDERPRPFSETDPKGQIPESIRAVVLRALEKSPADRYQTAEEFRAALQRALIGGATTRREPPVPRFVPRKKRPTTSTRTRTIGITAGGIFLAVFGAVVGKMLDLFPMPAPLLPAPAITTATTATSTASGSSVDVTATQKPVSTATETGGASDSRSAAAAVTEGKKLADAGDLRGAYEAYERATKADASNAFAWANLGAAAAKLRKSEEAALAYQRALALAPDNWLAHYNLGCLYARAGNADDAYEHISRAVEQLRRQARSPAELETYLKRMRTDDALEELRNDRRFTELLAGN